MNHKEAVTAVCNIAGYYDVFTISDCLWWLPHGQCIRDAVRTLVRRGLLTRIGRGVYRWGKA